MAEKIIIDTDPGIDDAMAIHLAFADPAVEVLGLTTIFGNVFVEQATRNALFLTEQAAYDCFVAEGCQTPLVQPQNPLLTMSMGQKDLAICQPASQKQQKIRGRPISPFLRPAAPIQVRWCSVRWDR